MSVSKEFRLVVVGPPVVGKSALTIRLTQSEFANEYDPTIEDSYRHYCTINNVESSLDILDTAGQEEYSSMRDLYMKTGEGFLLVFSLTDYHSFEEISTFYSSIMRVKGEQVSFVPMILVGNKSDLVDERQVSQEEAINFAKKFNCAYIETSAKTPQNVTDTFHNLVKIIINGQITGSGVSNTLYPDPKEEQRVLENLQKQEAKNAALSKKAADTTNSPTGGRPQNNKSTQPNSGSSNSKESGGCCVIM